jgi:hypothetical protein
MVFTGALTMMMHPARNPTNALGVGSTADAPDGASPPGNTGEARDVQRLQRMMQAICLGIFLWSMPAFLEDYLHACISGCGTLHRWVVGVEESLILEVESLQRKICKECCFIL